MGYHDKVLGFFDSLVNVVSRIGTSADKRTFNTYEVPALSQQEVDASYRTSWLAKKVINIPPYDMTREWRNWQAEDDQIEDIENEEKRLGLQKKTRRALTWGRLYGGGALILGVNQGKANEELRIDRVRKGQLAFIHAVSKWQLQGMDIIRDPMDDNFGQPRMWQVTGAQTGTVEVHPSRVIRFIGNELPDELAANYDGWGDSYWMSLRDTITDTDALVSVISSLVQEAKIDVISIPGLMDLVGTQEGETKVMRRITSALALKSNLSTLVLDGGTNEEGTDGEKYERKEMTFTGLADLARMYLSIAAGAADIPATRLLGKSPDGMNATGDSDTRNYYDALSSKQNDEMWPAIDPIDELMLRNIGFSDKDVEQIYFESGPLWQMTPSEKGAISKQKADTTKVYMDMGLINEEVMAEIVVNQLIEDEVYPGIEAAIDEFGLEPEEEEPPPALLTAPGVDPVTGEPMPAPPPAAVPAQQDAWRFHRKKKPARKKKSVDKRAVMPSARVIATGRVRVKDAEPRTLYIRRDVLNAKDIIDWARNSFATTLADDDMHVTVCYSTAPVDWMKIGSGFMGEDEEGRITIKPGGARLVERMGKGVALLFNSSELSWRHEDIKRAAGASYDYDEYQPHVTITYNVPADISKITPYRGALLLGPEVFEEIDYTDEDYEEVPT